MPCLAGAVDLVRGEGGFVHEEIRRPRSFDDGGGGRGAPVITTFRPRRGSPSTLSGWITVPSGSVTGSPC